MLFVIRGFFKIKIANLQIRRRCTIAADEGRLFRLNQGAMGLGLLPFVSRTQLTHERSENPTSKNSMFTKSLSVHRKKFHLTSKVYLRNYLQRMAVRKYKITLTRHCLKKKKSSWPLGLKVVHPKRSRKTGVKECYEGGFVFHKQDVSHAW